MKTQVYAISPSFKNPPSPLLYHGGNEQMTNKWWCIQTPSSRAITFSFPTVRMKLSPYTRGGTNKTKVNFLMVPRWILLSLQYIRTGKKEFSNLEFVLTLHIDPQNLKIFSPSWPKTLRFQSGFQAWRKKVLQHWNLISWVKAMCLNILLKVQNWMQTSHTSHTSFPKSNAWRMVPSSQLKCPKFFSAWYLFLKISMPSLMKGQ